MLGVMEDAGSRGTLLDLSVLQHPATGTLRDHSSIPAQQGQGIWAPL